MKVTQLCLVCVLVEPNKLRVGGWRLSAQSADRAEKAGLVAIIHKKTDQKHKINKIFGSAKPKVPGSNKVELMHQHGLHWASNTCSNGLSVVLEGRGRCRAFARCEKNNANESETLSLLAFLSGSEGAASCSDSLHSNYT